MKKEQTKYLLLGNSTAAVAAIEGIRGVDRDSPVVILAGERRHTYSRPLISHLLAGELAGEQLFFRPKSFYEDNGVQAKLGVSAQRIDVSNKVVFTDNGAEYQFEKLLIAIGGKPVMPPIEGIGHEGVFTFTSWDDADAIDDYIRNYSDKKAAPRAVVVGAGLIGLKAAEALKARSLKVVLVEREDRILPMSLERKGSRLLEQAVCKAGVTIQCGVTVEKINGDSSGRVSGVALNTGEELPCEIVIIAAGVKPAVDIMKNTPIKVDKGIVIDDACMTSVPGIYAAGDVAQSFDFLCGFSRPMPIFCNAAKQGRVAGINMAGGDALLSDVCVLNSVEIFGLPTISAGLSTVSGPEYKILEKMNASDQSYKRIVLKDDRIVGTLFVGEIDRAGIMTGLMREKVDVSSIADELLTRDFGLLSLPREYRKHVVKGEGIEV